MLPSNAYLYHIRADPSSSGSVALFYQSTLGDKRSSVHCSNILHFSMLHFNSTIGIPIIGASSPLPCHMGERWTMRAELHPLPLRQSYPNTRLESMTLGICLHLTAPSSPPPPSPTYSEMQPRNHFADYTPTNLADHELGEREKRRCKVGILRLSG